MKELRLQHCADYDQLGVQTSKPEMLLARSFAPQQGSISIGIGVDPLDRREYALTSGEALRLADWIYSRLAEVSSVA